MKSAWNKHGFFNVTGSTVPIFVKRAARGSLKINIGHKNSPKTPSAHHRTTLSGYIFATRACIDNRKKIVKQRYLDISSTCSHNMVNFNPLTAEIGWRVWGTSANFNGVRVLVSLLHRRRSMEVYQTLHDVWPSPELVHYLYTFGGSCSVT